MSGGWMVQPSGQPRGQHSSGSPLADAAKSFEHFGLNAPSAAPPQRSVTFSNPHGSSPPRGGMQPSVPTFAHAAGQSVPYLPQQQPQQSFVDLVSPSPPNIPPRRSSPHLPDNPALRPIAPPSFSSSPPKDPSGITVEMTNGSYVSLPYDPSWMVADIKRELNDREALDPSRQRLWKEDVTYGWVELNDHDLLDQAGVRGGMLLRLTLHHPSPYRQPQHSATPITQATSSPQRDPYYSHAADDPLSQAQEPLLSKAGGSTGEGEAKEKTKKIRIVRDSASQRIGMRVNEAMGITEVLDDTPAAKAGVKPGMMLLMVNGQPVNDESSLIEAERQAPPSFEILVCYMETEADRSPTDRPLQEHGFLWFVHRAILWFLIFLCVLVGLIFLGVYGAEKDLPCDHPSERWTLGAGLLLLLWGLGAGMSLGCLMLNSHSPFDPRDPLSMAVLVCVSFLVLILVILSIVGLALITREMDRAERDTCSPFRSCVIFLCIATAVLVLLLGFVGATKSTWTHDRKRIHAEAKRMRALHHGMPSNNPKDYLLDPENSSVPYHYL